MKRLTFDGLFCDIAKCDSTPGGTFCESGTCTQRRVWERLKEYEDTGLEPEQVMELKSFTQGGIHKVDDGWKHVQELLQAEQDGRLVVLPCKVGDTVYQIDAERVYESEVKWIIFDCDDIAFDERAIGGSIFLTREEAEAALKGGEGL